MDLLGLVFSHLWFKFHLAPLCFEEVFLFEISPLQVLVVQQHEDVHHEQEQRRSQLRVRER